MDSSHLGDLVVTADGSLTLRHPEHGEDYHSSIGAAFESENLYLGRSSFSDRLKQQNQPLQVLDVGLGLAYNAMTTLDRWYIAPQAGPLHMVSLEVNHDLVEVLVGGKAPWAKAWPKRWHNFTGSMRHKNGQWSGQIQHPDGSLADWNILVGDAQVKEIELVGGRLFDFIWQDPFSPAKNPGLWSSAWFSKLRQVSAPDAELLTYSVARAVKQGLEEGGWQWQKIPGHGHKRHWLKACIKC